MAGAPRDRRDRAPSLDGERPGHGQDEKSPVLAEIVDPFDDPALALWMKRFNPGRI